MRIYPVAITFAVTIGTLFLFENFKTTPPEPDYAKIIGELRQTGAPPSPIPKPSKSPAKTIQPAKRPAVSITATPSPVPFQSPTFNTPSPISRIFYTSSSARAKYYYCDTDSGWKALSQANLKQFSSPEELLKSYPNRTLHESCK